MRSCAGEGGAEGEQGVLGVVAGKDGFSEAGGAFGLQAGEEDGGLDLGGGDGRGEVDSAERTAMDGDGRMPSTSSIFAPIWLRGFGYAPSGARVREGSPMRVKVWGWEAMRPDSMRMVEPELPQSSGAAGWRKAPATPVIWMVSSGIAEDGCAEGLHAGERGVWIGPGGEVGEARCAFGQAGEHGVAVGDGLVAGHGEGALQGAGGANDLGGHACTSVARGGAMLARGDGFTRHQAINERRVGLGRAMAAEPRGEGLSWWHGS